MFKLIFKKHFLYYKDSKSNNDSIYINSFGLFIFHLLHVNKNKK